MSYEPMVEQAARATAEQLVPQYGVRVQADVEAALYSGGEHQPPGQFVDPVALGALIVAIAQLAYQIYGDFKSRGEKPTPDDVARKTRVEWRKETDLTTGAEKIIEIVSTEITEYGEHGELQ